jgi:hypothetical protein
MNNDEYHDLINDLTERKFYGEVTFYFQGGNIESNRLSERNTKSEIRDKMQAKKRKVVVSRHAGGTV